MTPCRGSHTHTHTHHTHTHTLWGGVRNLRRVVAQAWRPGCNLRCVPCFGLTRLAVAATGWRFCGCTLQAFTKGHKLNCRWVLWYDEVCTCALARTAPTHMRTHTHTHAHAHTCARTLPHTMRTHAPCAFIKRVCPVGFVLC